jgi:hypothetical protein
VVEDFAAPRRGSSPPQLSDLDLETLKSASVMHADEPVASKTSPREIALWSLAAVVAIVLGVIPALWINRWRAESAAPRVEATQPQAAATTDEDEAETTETIEMIAEPVGASLPGTTPATIKVIKTHRAKERVKQPPRVRKQPPPCNVYLHPKGCPH